MWTNKWASTSQHHHSLATATHHPPPPPPPPPPPQSSPLLTAAGLDAQISAPRRNAEIGKSRCASCAEHRHPQTPATRLHVSACCTRSDEIPTPLEGPRVPSTYIHTYIQLSMSRRMSWFANAQGEGGGRGNDALPIHPDFPASTIIHPATMARAGNSISTWYCLEHAIWTRWLIQSAFDQIMG